MNVLIEKKPDTIKGRYFLYAFISARRLSYKIDMKTLDPKTNSYFMINLKKPEAEATNENIVNKEDNKSKKEEKVKEIKSDENVNKKEKKSKKNKSENAASEVNDNNNTEAASKIKI